MDAWLSFVNDPASAKLTGATRWFTREEIERHCASRAEQESRLDYAIHDGSDAFIGELAVKDFSESNRACSFRIALGMHATNRGMGSEATRLIVDHVIRLGIHRIDLEVYDFNSRARHVYEKLGFVYEGTMRDSLRWDDQWYDTHLMSLLAPDWGGL